MGIVDRIGRAARANLNALFDSAEDPDRVIGQTLEEMAAGIKAAKKDATTTLATAKRAIAESESHMAEATRWEERAKLALKAGDEGLAREALAQKLLEDKQASRCQASAAQHRQAVVELERTIETLEERRAELSSKRALLVNKVRAARTQPTTATSANPAAGRVDELDRMTARIDAMEAEVAAANVLDDPKKADLEARFAALEDTGENDALEDQLAALKQQLD